ncbi:copper resistance CopC family protein [Actinomadura keratinilytica]|uniref:CopC domain-containing protein n=1 Tax=Actinomadura keratinilytica TaxID=547461 RepID=A0ABP7YM84_9ACTN
MRGLRVLLAGLVAVLAVGVAAPPASAHDALKEAKPASGDTVEPPSEIVLTYTNTVRLPQVVVTDDKGTAVQSGAPEASDNKVTQALNGTLPDGEYTVAWRVVSSDGHPIKGSYKFTVKGSPASAGSPSPAGADVSVSSAPAPAAPSTQGASGESEEGGSSGWLWIGLAAVAVAAVAGGVAWARRPRQN